MMVIEGSPLTMELSHNLKKVHRDDNEYWLEMVLDQNE